MPRPNASREFLLFLATGGTAALTNILSRVVLDLFMPFEVAIVLAYLCGMVVAYLLARAFVFGRSGRGMRDEFLRFGLVNLAGIVQVWAISVALARLVFPAIGWVWHPELLAHVIGVAAPTVTSFLGHKYFSFAPTSGPR